MFDVFRVMIGSRRDCFVVVQGSPMRALILVSGLLAMSGLCGCQGEWGERGVPEEVRGVYALGDLYRLKKPVFLHRTDDMTGYRFLIAPTSDPPGSLLYSLLRFGRRLDQAACCGWKWSTKS